MKRTWTQNLTMQLVSLVILCASAAAFGLGRPAPAPAASVARLEMDSATLGPVAGFAAVCGLEADVAPSPPPRPRFGAARCTD